MRNPGGLMPLILLLLASLVWPGQLAALTEPPAKIGLVVYITTSKACGCTLELCQAGDKVIEQVFTASRTVPLERIDHGRDPEAAKGFIMDYRLFTLPALLILDNRGQLLARWQGVLKQEAILAKLQEYGLK